VRAQTHSWCGDPMSARGLLSDIIVKRTLLAS
jgi:hypothetical protein